MKIFLLLFILTFSAQAVEIIFINPCENNFIMKTKIHDKLENVGELTIFTLKKFNIPFVGNPKSLASAFETPVGQAAIEVVSSEEYRAYGWCYSVDGLSPDFYPDEIPITQDTKTVTWHFGFARFYQGKWITQCTPSYTVRPAFLCKDPTAE